MLTFKKLKPGKYLVLFLKKWLKQKTDCQKSWGLISCTSTIK